jgi:hypothetical protein
VALLGLIMLGLLGLGAVILIQLQNRQEQDVIVVQPPTLPPPTFTPTPTVTPTPTDTPDPTPTPTLVVQPGQEQPGQPPVPPDQVPGGPEVTPTNTLVVQPTGTPAPGPPVAGPPAGPGAMPDGGGVPPLASSGYLMGAGIMLLVLLTAGAVNRLKR